MWNIGIYRNIGRALVTDNLDFPGFSGRNNVIFFLRFKTHTASPPHTASSALHDFRTDDSIYVGGIIDLEFNLVFGKLIQHNLIGIHILDIDGRGMGGRIPGVDKIGQPNPEPLLYFVSECIERYILELTASKKCL